MAPVSAPRRSATLGGAPQGRPDASPPRLRVVGPPTRRRAPWSLRPTLFVVVGLVLGSLLLVAGAQAYMTQEQVRLTNVQTQLATQAAEHHDLEYRVAQLSNPAHIVAAAQSQGLTVPSQVTDLTPVTVPPVTHPASSSKTKTTTPAHSGPRARASGAGGR
jgi:cell division protein FtsL